MSITINPSCSQNVLSRELVVLKGMDESGLNTDISFKWTQLDGGKIKLEDTNSSRPYFNAPIVPLESIYVFELIATGPDNCVVTSKHTVIVNPEVSADLHEPLKLELVYDAVVVPGKKTSMKVIADNPKERHITFNYYQTKGPDAILVTDGLGAVYFTAPNVIDSEGLEFEVTVSDGCAIPSIGVFKFNTES